MGSLAARQLAIAASFLASFLLTYEIIYALGVLKSTVAPEIYLIRIALSLTGFFFPILGGWLAFRFPGGALFAFFAAVMVFFAGIVASSAVFVWFLFEYVGLIYVLFCLDQYFENQVAALSVDREKYQNEKNDLEIAHKAKGEGISMLFEKYSTYYNLRKLAEEMAATPSVTGLAQLIANRTFDFIPRGGGVHVALSDAAGENFLIAGQRLSARTKAQTEAARSHEPDPFDSWVIRNQRRLIVTDIQQDFRFDVGQAVKLGDLRSLIIAPLLHERRVIGTLRINAASSGAFSNDDLRLLDTIAVLASSALSNAMLYEKTEELAIKDFLTGLYVRRHFFERLKEEHRRALMTHRPLSVLMCDLDHFKSCNDRHGHAAGDLMLVEFASILRHESGEGLVCRYGGEEFSVILPEAGKAEASALAERVRRRVESHAFAIRRVRITMTVSIGVANLPDDALDMETLVAKADQALYRAKREGRNKVCLSAGS